MCRLMTRIYEQELDEGIQSKEAFDDVLRAAVGVFNETSPKTYGQVHEKYDPNRGGRYS